MSGINLLVRLVISAGLLIVALGQTGINANAAHSGADFSICTSPIKVMPLGDSITTGKYSGHDTSNGTDADKDDIGYRKDLWVLLTGAGYSVDFIGSQENGATYPFSDPQHEGHNGQTDAYIADNIYNNGGENWLSQNPPDVILLHIGTNSLDTDPSDVEDILDEIDEYESDTGRTVTVFVARIINKVPNEPLVKQFNGNVEAMVQGRADYGAELFMVDMEDGAGLNYSIYDEVNNPIGDMIDDLHPYATGYAKMANAWMAAFDDVCAHRPNLKNLFDRFSIEGSGAGVKITATDPDNDPLTFTAQGLPEGLSINPSDGWITGVTQDGATLLSPYEVTVRVQDDGGLADQGTFNWYVDTTGSIYLPIAIR